MYLAFMQQSVKKFEVTYIIRSAVGTIAIKQNSTREVGVL